MSPSLSSQHKQAQTSALLAQRGHCLKCNTVAYFKHPQTQGAQPTAGHTTDLLLHHPKYTAAFCLFLHEKRQAHSHTNTIRHQKLPQNRKGPAGSQDPAAILLTHQQEETVGHRPRMYGGPQRSTSRWASEVARRQTPEHRAVRPPGLPAGAITTEVTWGSPQPDSPPPPAGPQLFPLKHWGTRGAPNPQPALSLPFLGIC